MSKRDLTRLSAEEKEADAAINRYAKEHGVLKCVGYRKGVFTYLDMSVATGKFRLASEPKAPFDKTATDIKLNYSMSSHKATVSIRVVTHLHEANHFSKPAFEHHWTMEEWFRTYWQEWQTVQVKWPRPCPEKVKREAQKENKRDHEYRRTKVSEDEIDRLVAKLEDLELSNRELLTSNANITSELETLRAQQESVERYHNQLVQKEEQLTYWWTQKTEYEKQQLETARSLELKRRQEVRHGMLTPQQSAVSRDISQLNQEISLSTCAGMLGETPCKRNQEGSRESSL